VELSFFVLKKSVLACRIRQYFAIKYLAMGDPLLIVVSVAGLFKLRSEWRPRIVQQWKEAPRRNKGNGHHLLPSTVLPW